MSTRETGAEGVKDGYQVDKAQPGDGDSERDELQSAAVLPGQGVTGYLLRSISRLAHQTCHRVRTILQMNEGNNCEKKKN